MFPPEGCEYPYPQAGHSFYPASHKAVRGRVCHLEHSLRSGIRNMGTVICPPAKETGYPWTTREGRMRDGASVVVRGRESRLHGEGRQETDWLLRPEDICGLRCKD